MKVPSLQQIDYHIAWRLAQLREAKGITREQLANLTKIQTRRIYRFEAAHLSVSAHELAVLAEFLDSKPSDFIRKSDITDTKAEMPGPITTNTPTPETIELVRTFLKISSEKTRHAFSSTARQASRHY